MDLVYVGITVLFFVVAVAYAAGCNRLAPSAKVPGAKGGAS